MSNEMKDWITDNKQEARWWIEKYPFLMIKDNHIYPWLKIGSTEDHWLAELPDGWLYSFGEKMCDELLAVLGKYVDDFIIIQVKEKYGEMRLYWHWRDRKYANNEVADLNALTDAIHSIIDGYMTISGQTCAKCGAPAMMRNDGWIIPYCDDCWGDIHNNVKRFQK